MAQKVALITGIAGQGGSCLAEIAGIKLCESYNRQYGRGYRSVMPTNLYDSSRLNSLGWHARVGLQGGLALAGSDFQNQATFT